MSFISSLRAAARLAPMLALPFLAASCDDKDDVCSDQLSVTIDSMVDASADLSAEATMISNTLLQACDGLITDFGGTPPAHTGTLDAQVMASCQAASTAISTARGQAQLTIEYRAPRCYVNAQAQVACEAECDVDATCTEGSVEARCEPGEFSVECNGTCTAQAECVATVQQPTVQCNGTCEGVCEGTCNGSANNNGANGQCNGTCAGSCRGACSVTPGSASASCTGEFRCEGSCTGTATAPRCDVELTPPMCMVDAQCSAGCEAQASIDADCEPGYLDVTASGTVNDGAFNSQGFKDHLLLILSIRERIEFIVDAGAQLGVSFGGLATAVRNEAACAAIRLNAIADATASAAAAAASVNVSVSVSVSVTGSASGSL